MRQPGAVLVLTVKKTLSITVIYDYDRYIPLSAILFLYVLRNPQGLQYSSTGVPEYLPIRYFYSTIVGTEYGMLLVSLFLVQTGQVQVQYRYKYCAYVSHNFYG